MKKSAVALLAFAGLAASAAAQSATYEGDGLAFGFRFADAGITFVSPTQTSISFYLTNNLAANSKATNSNGTFDVKSLIAFRGRIWTTESAPTAGDSKSGTTMRRARLTNAESGWSGSGANPTGDTDLPGGPGRTGMLDPFRDVIGNNNNASAPAEGRNGGTPVSTVLGLSHNVGVSGLPGSSVGAGLGNVGFQDINGVDISADNQGSGFGRRDGSLPELGVDNDTFKFTMTFSKFGPRSVTLNFAPNGTKDSSQDNPNTTSFQAWFYDDSAQIARTVVIPLSKVSVSDFSFNVNNEAPVVNTGVDGNAVKILQGDSFSSNWTKSDPEGQPTTWTNFSGTGTFDLNTGAYNSGVLTVVGQYQATATASDGFVDGSNTLTITVSENKPVDVTGGAIVIAQNTAFNFAFVGVDPEGRPITWTLGAVDPALTGGAVDASGNASGSSTDALGTFDFVVNASDGFNTSSGTLKVTVVPAPGALALLGLGGLIAGRRRR